jgi:hypothetical protein
LAIVMIVAVLAGCDAAVSRPSNQPSATENPSVSTSPASGSSPTTGPARATATPGPSADPGQLALQRFDALISDPKLAYHVSASAVTRAGGVTARFSESLNVSGSNYAGTVNSVGPGASGRSSVVYFRGVVYLNGRGTDRRWISSRRSDTFVQIAPFLYLRTEDIDYVRPVTVDGRALFLLRSTDSYMPDKARMLGLAGMNVGADREWLEVYVTASGTPVRAIYHVDAGTGVSGKPLLVGRSIFSFNRVGASFTIVRPTH